MKFFVRNYFHFLLSVFTIVYLVRFYDVIETIITYEEKCFLRGEGFRKNLNTTFCKILDSCDDHTKISSKT